MTISRELNINCTKSFAEHLGKARTDRIRYAQSGKNKRFPAGVNIENMAYEALKDSELNDFPEIENILYGIVNATDDERIPLSIQRLFNVFRCLPVINSREIQKLTGLQERTARRYMRAAKIAYPFVVKQLAQ